VSLEILQSSNEHSCIPQAIRSVSRGTHCSIQESSGKTELQTNSANWELSNYGGIQIYGRRCLYVALHGMPRRIIDGGQQCFTGLLLTLPELPAARFGFALLPLLYSCPQRFWWNVHVNF